MFGSHHAAVDQPPNVWGGAMPNGITKTHLDWEIYRSSQIPAPGQHNVNTSFDYLGRSTGNLPNGQRFGKNISKSLTDEIQVIIRRTARGIKSIFSATTSKSLSGAI
jgi:hypothetical protein